MFKKEHLKKAPKKVKFTIITVSSSRYKRISNHMMADDVTGNIAVKILEKYGLKFNSRYLVPDDKDAIVSIVLKSIHEDKSNLIILVGGTGVSNRDVTIEAILPLFNKKLTSFETIFSLLSYMQIGADCIMSRATGGVINKSAVFLLPGSDKAVKLALDKIIGPEIRHLLHHLRE
ncbi:molybdenum cofactor biosynthesis protein [Candidatus Geothermarchaeota archaeon]|nr:MAG: molybdenum cofactor biosynthesis protein [Candidatus Geothermarchaeota archaeon]